jgi:hypothetical protein
MAADCLLFPPAPPLPCVNRWFITREVGPSFATLGPGGVGSLNHNADLVLKLLAGTFGEASFLAGRADRLNSAVAMSGVRRVV